MSDFVAVAGVNQVPPDRGLSVHVGTRELALFNVSGRFYALDGRCPHRSGPLGEGLIENGCVYCPMHGWQFDVKTGACINRPDKPVACFPTRVVNGKVEICV
jgi:NAD(P)H-dependent nitrite reductase small subunit